MFLWGQETKWFGDECVVVGGRPSPVEGLLVVREGIALVLDSPG